MNLHALRIFVEVASKGNVTTAAASLSISQPAVSAQIRTQAGSRAGKTAPGPERQRHRPYSGRTIFVCAGTPHL
ncbi:LysR family transcriptional regulator [Brevibacillus borstelensis]|uniref:LysR family transcriptional regulator n=1 Tax=Brevibacillus borstelensis TaxID=45462 RepID=UPI0035C8C05C